MMKKWNTPEIAALDINRTEAGGRAPLLEGSGIGTNEYNANNYATDLPSGFTIEPVL